MRLIDGKLATPEETRAFLEPYSPPAPPPRATVKRSRAKRGAEAKTKEDSYDDEEGSEEPLDHEDDLDDIGGDDDDLNFDLGLPKASLHTDMTEESEIAEGEEKEGEVLPEPATKPAKVKRVSKRSTQPKSALPPAVEPVKAEEQATDQAALQPEKAEEQSPVPTPEIEPGSESKTASAHPKKTASKAAKPSAKAAKPKAKKPAPKPAKKQ